MEQLGAEAIALARHEDQEAAIDQRGGEPVGGRARQPHPRGQFGQRDGAVDDLTETVQPAQQRLAALRPGLPAIVVRCPRCATYPPPSLFRIAIPPPGRLRSTSPPPHL